MSASRVVSIAFATTGLTLLSTISSKMFVLCGDDLIEMLERHSLQVEYRGHRLATPV
jgi:hypothetical protein